MADCRFSHPDIALFYDHRTKQIGPKPHDSCVEFSHSTGLQRQAKHSCRTFSERRDSAMSNNIIARIAALPGMTAPQLKKLWQELHTTEPPPFNKPYFVKRLAYRIQELAYGADSKMLERRLETYARQHMDIQGKSIKKVSTISPDKPVAGTRLMREHGRCTKSQCCIMASTIGASVTKACHPSPAPLPVPNGQDLYSLGSNGRQEAAHDYKNKNPLRRLKSCDMERMTSCSYFVPLSQRSWINGFILSRVLASSNKSRRTRCGQVL